MEYFSKSELTKSYDNGKLYVGGYSVDLDEPNIQTYKNDTDSIMDILNLGLSIPLIYYTNSNSNSNNKSYIKNTYDNSVINESLHNKLIGIVNKSSSKTKKNKNYSKKTKKNYYNIS
tara:strand:+ start:94 stop:444 length:351 start_codon:yes stop_codon:yes gene_type:complete